jgi:hypothetical protein
MSHVTTARKYLTPHVTTAGNYLTLHLSLQLRNILLRICLHSWDVSDSAYITLSRKYLTPHYHPQLGISISAHVSTADKYLLITVFRGQEVPLFCFISPPPPLSGLEDGLQ